MTPGLKILAWDIETFPHNVYRWSLYGDSPVALNQIREPGRVASFAARWVGEPKNSIEFYSEFSGYALMVHRAWHLIDEADALLSWNGKPFDSKHMNREFILHGLGPPSPVVEIDLLRTARSRFKFPSNKLEYVAQALGVGGKVKHSGFDLWVGCMANDPKAWAQMEKYNKQDVHLLIDLYKILLPWITGHPNMLLFGGTGCTKCGSGRLQKRGTRVTQLGRYQRFQCQKCGSWNTSGKALDRVDTRSE